MLMTAQQLQQYIQNKTSGLKIFDCRFNLMQPNEGLQSYNKGHIDQAVYVDLNLDLAAPVTKTSGRHPLPSKEKWTETLQKLGIEEDSICVVYDDVSGAMAARLWWMLKKWNGLEHVYILDGGIQAWQKIDDLSVAIKPLTPSTIQVKFDDAQWLTSNDVIEAKASGNATLIDARALARFEGKQEPIDKKKGHVPDALNYSFDGNLENSFLKSSEDIKLRFKDIIDDNKPIISMCGSGVTACHNIFTLNMIGVDAKLYVGSWSEWIADDSRPIAIIE